MRKEVKLESSSEIKDFSEYSENKLAIAKVCVLSTAKNSHQLEISEEVLRRDIGSIRGNFLVADMIMGDASTHTLSEVPVGYFLPNEEIEFEEVDTNDGKIVKAWAYAVLSKQYAKSAYDMFVMDNHRATSIEMTVITDEEDENKVLSFDAYGSTILGKTVAPSCKDAEISLVRFAEEAESFFKESNRLTALQKFAEERKQAMSEKKTYKIDKSKEAMVETSWSDVDKTQLRNKIIEAKNASILVKSVYLKVDADWKSASSEKLHYPVMQFKGDTLVYNKNALSNAKARAVQNNETEVVKKIDKIYKSLDIGEDNKGKEEDAKMSKEIKFAAVEISDMWAKVYSAIRKRDCWRYGIEGIYETDNQKFAVLKDEDGTLYRLDFSLTEDGMTVADEIVAVQKDFIETNDVVKFAEPEDVEKYRTFVDDEDDDKDEDDCDPEDKKEGDDDCKDGEEKDAKMSVEEMEAEMARLKKDVEDRDNIIMEKDAELAELRAFKKGVEDKEKAMSVETVMEEIKGFIDETKFKEFREEGLSCGQAELDAWKNKVKAFCFEANSKSNKPRKRESFFSWSAPIEGIKKDSKSLWD